MNNGRCLNLVLAGLGLLSVAASPALALKSRARLDPTTLTEVPSPCADGSRGWRVPPEGTLSELRTVLGAFPWQARRYPAPDLDCRATLELACAPDLDGDGGRDFLARLRWQQRLGPARGKACAELPEDDVHLVRHEAILVLRKSGTPPTWQVLDVVNLAVDGIDGMAVVRVDFVALPDGRHGVRCKVQTAEQGAGCQVTALWVGALMGDRLERLGEADPRLCRPD